jgi:solute carrier family 25 phosphate transporter 23/24/25/41
MNHARQFLKICFGSLLLISQYPQSPSSPDFLPSEMCMPVDVPSVDSPTLPPRNDAPIAEVRKGRFQDHAAVLIPDPGYFVAGGLAGVASRKYFTSQFMPLSPIHLLGEVIQ